jgi:uncharacterized membrane protein
MIAVTRLSALVSALLIAHVLAAVVGFGTLFSTGGYAAAARRTRRSEHSPAVRRYFAPGRNVVGHVLYLVPIFGFALLGAQGGADLGRPFPWVGLACWLGATLLATRVLWPAQKRVQELMAAPSAVGDGLSSCLRRCERAAGASAVLFVIALFFMLVQPG